MDDLVARKSRAPGADRLWQPAELPRAATETWQKAERAVLITWVLAGSLLVYLTTISVPHIVQTRAATAILLAMAILLAVANRSESRGLFTDHLRTVILVLGGILTLRYLSWRVAYTVNFHDPASFLAAVSLLGAEIYGILMYVLGSTVNAKPLQRPIRQPDLSALPTVDVLIPTYNEDEEILEVTVLAATQLDYPADRLRVYVLDDGGTDAKIDQPDPQAAAQARNRRSSLRSLCVRTGAIYMTREDNRDAKAGNINAALPRISGDLLLMLDADHVPSSDFLMNTVGAFQADPNLFLVQTPHRFVTPDPVEKNLEIFRKMPGESEIFYRVVQHGLDAWRSSFFCGSAAVMRRQHLDRLGGLSGETVTEDAETAMRLHALGYNSAYVGRPMVFGLQPETFSGFIGQRCRWAQGMVQLFLLRNPLLEPGLRRSQRLGYLNSTLFWFFSYARLIFLLAPCAFLLLGLKIYDANLEQFLIYAMPHLVGTLITANLLFGRARWILFSELYEAVQAIFSSRAITQVLKNPRAPVFNVTSKGERLQHDYISSMAWPFYLILLLLSLALVAGFYRYQVAPGQREVVYITAGWATLNLFIILAGIGALLERHQLRSAPRVYLSRTLPARLLVAGAELPGRLSDISMAGVSVRLDDPWPATMAEEEGVLHVDLTLSGGKARFPVRLVRLDAERGAASFVFTERTTEIKRAIVSIGYGNAENMSWGVERRGRTPGIVSGIVIFLFLALRQAGDHMAHLTKASWRLMRSIVRAVLGVQPELTRQGAEDSR